MLLGQVQMFNLPHCYRGQAPSHICSVFVFE